MHRLAFIVPALGLAAGASTHVALQLEPMRGRALSGLPSCNSLPSDGVLVVPATVTSIGKDAYRECADLKRVEIETRTPADQPLTIGLGAFRNSGLNHDAEHPLVIPAAVTSIGGIAFYKCADLKRVELETRTADQPLTIGNFAFKESGLNHDAEHPLVIPAAVTSIGNGAFYNCADLKRVEIETRTADQPLAIGSDAFSKSGLDCPELNVKSDGLNLDHVVTECAHVSYKVMLPSPSPPPPSPSPPPPSPPPPDLVATTVGDPITWFNGLLTRFFLAAGRFTRMLDHAGPLSVFYRGGSLEDDGRASHGDFIKGVKLVCGADGASFKEIQIDVVDARMLLLDAHDAPSPAPIAGEALKTMRVTLDGQPLLAGRHMLSDGAVFASAIPTKRIGPAYKERVHIVLPGLGFAVRITSAKANKFARPELQVKGLHLDVEFTQFNRTSVRGPLAEMWGLVGPVSEATMALLVPPKASVSS